MITQGCQDSYLSGDVHSQISPKNLKSKNGIKSVLLGAYAQASYNGYVGHTARNHQEWTTDILFDSRGGESRIAIQLQNFTWDASLQKLYSAMWIKPYRAIRDANTVLDNINDVKDMSNSKKKEYTAEAKFIRAIMYIRLYSWFGPVPLRTSTKQNLEIKRPTKKKMKQFIESELLAVIPELPAPGEEVAYGRANKGAARAFLTKFYLNTKQWQKAADMAKKVMDMDYYHLFPNYFDMFKIKNNGPSNRAFIWVIQEVARGGHGNNYVNGAWPPNFEKWPKTGLTFQPSWRNWGTQYRLYDDFYYSFSPNDERKALIMTKYITTKGDTVDLLKSGLSARSIKYYPGEVPSSGNDHPGDRSVIRYADILLSRAEALNDLNGPNQESIDLINKARERAGLKDLKLSQFPTKKSLNDHILKERGWEFYTEGGIRREDLIRMGKFVKQARERGATNAVPSDTLFPIPQKAMDSNPKLKQNPGY
jgi:hypothetical protein